MTDQQAVYSLTVVLCIFGAGSWVGGGGGGGGYYAIILLSV